MGKRRRTRNVRPGPNTPHRPSRASATGNDRVCGMASKGDPDHREPAKEGKLRSDRYNDRLQSDPGRLQRTTQLQRSLPRSPKPPKFGKHTMSSSSPSLKNLFDHKYDRVIRDVVHHGTVLEQKLRTLIDNLTKIKSDPEEMEWEVTNTTYLVPEQPPYLRDVSFAKISSQASYRPPRLETFEGIHLDLSKQPGKCKIAESGLGWKASGGGDPFTLDSSNIVGAQWSRAAKGYELKITSRTEGVVQLDGFEQEDHDRVAKAFKLWYAVNVDTREHALRGWNWGKGEFGKAELVFNVQNRPAFEIPYSEISNTNLAGKNEVAVEFSLPGNGSEGTTNGHSDPGRSKGRKAGGGRDQLVEMRFYIPGTATKKGKVEDGEDKSVDGEDAEEQNAANLFYDTLMDKAEIGEVAGDTFATFLDVLHLTPRGRFDIDMYENSFRLRGKTYDYKIQYEAIKKFMLLPKPDDLHTLITIGLDPPLRQGQTRYPFLVMQFKRDEEVIIDLNMTEELLKEKYNGKLQSHYESPQHAVVAQVFRGLAGKKVVTPSKDFVSHHQQSGVKCSIKANEGLLFCLDKSFMFVPKPASYISFDNISVITMSRVGGAISASRTFDITITLKGGQGEHQFSNINREEQQPLEDFFKTKNLKTKNEMLDDSSALIAAALKDEDMASSEEEVVAARADRGSADEDEESIDEDFHADSESDVAEEYDSAHESSGGDSDAEMGDAGADADGDSDPPAEVAERPKKKAKTSN